MRKKKENLRLQQKFGNLPISDALETENEQRYEEMSGETETEDLGPAYNTAGQQHARGGSDGPPAGTNLNPPLERASLTRARARKQPRPDNLPRRKSKHPQSWKQKGNHLAARSPKKI